MSASCHHLPLLFRLYTKITQTEIKMSKNYTDCKQFGVTVFTKKLLVHFTIDYKETATNTPN